MNDSSTDFVEARRRASALSDAQWLAWLAYVESRNGVLTLPFDGAAPFAEYPRVDVATGRRGAAMDQSK